MTDNTKTPDIVEDEALDQAAGGGSSVPIFPIKKHVDKSTPAAASSAHSSGALFGLSDGSVRNV